MRIGIDPDHITYLDAGRIAEDCGRAPRSRCTAGPRSSTTPGRPTGHAIATLKAARHQHPGARQRGHLRRRRRAGDDGRRPAATGWSSAAAARAGRGCSPTWRPRSTGGRRRRRRTWARWPRCCAGTPSCSPTGGRGPWAARPAQAHGLVLQGLSGGRRTAPWPGDGVHPCRTGPAAGTSTPSPFPAADLGSPRGRQGSPRDGWCCPMAGSTPRASGMRTSPTPNRTSPAAEGSRRMPSSRRMPGSCSWNTGFGRFQRLRDPWASPG